MERDRPLRRRQRAGALVNLGDLNQQRFELGEVIGFGELRFAVAEVEEGEFEAVAASAGFRRELAFGFG
ncbi:MAG: hypothetical protein U0992_24880 [Planctomycetaceae bacterium]